MKMIVIGIMAGPGESWYQENRQEAGQVHGCSAENSGGGGNQGPGS